MDNAVSLVQAYLRLQGYFTVSEYPVIAAGGSGGYRMATDLDILAIRFPKAGQLVPGRARGGSTDENHLEVDPALRIPTDHVDMILGEVKEGRATLNAPATDPGVVRATLVAFGCCEPAHAPGLAATLLREGQVALPSGHVIRVVIFASQTEGARGRYDVVGLRQGVFFLRSYVRTHWEVLRHWDSKDPAIGFLITLAKAEAATGPS